MSQVEGELEPYAILLTISLYFCHSQDKILMNDIKALEKRLMIRWLSDARAPSTSARCKPGWLYRGPAHGDHARPIKKQNRLGLLDG